MRNQKIWKCLPLVAWWVWSLCCPTAVRAQLDSLVYAPESGKIQPEQKNELRVTVDAMAFFRDNEYNTKHLVKGYTLPGAWLAPSVSYQPLRNLKLEVGAFMLHYWGANRYPNANYTNLESAEAQKTTKAFHCVPIIRGNMQLTPNLNIVIGTLYGKTAHGLVEPLYNDEMNITGDPETGVQVIWQPHWMRFDTWVNWQDFIFKDDIRQERFCYGLSTRFYPSRRQARTQWYIPLQLLMQHIGGEVNTEAQERTIKTWLNAAWGAGFNVPLRTKVPVTLGAEVDACYFSQQSGAVLPFDKGYGVLAQVRARVWRIGLTAGYWQAKDFIPVLGSPLYSAMSTSTTGVTLTNPRMWMLRAEYAQVLGKGFSWGMRLGFDMHQQHAIHDATVGTTTHRSMTNDFDAGIYLRLTPSFLIKKFKTDQTR